MTTPLPVDRVNTILYCRAWTETVAFYRDMMGFEVMFENDWFVEFGVGANGYLSIANTERASIAAADGAGVTLSWQVADLEACHTMLDDRNASPRAIHSRWGSQAFHVFDPEGHRIEFWSQPMTE